MSVWQVILGSIAPVLALVGTVLVAMMTRKGGRETTRSADWDAFMDQQQKWTEARLAERDKRIESLEGGLVQRDKRIDGLEQDVKDLRQEFDALLRKYRLAVGYIRRIVRQLRQHVPPEEIEPPPADIEPDIF